MRAGAEVVGIDVAEEPLRRARASDPGLDLRLVDADGPWPLRDASFDVVWAGETIEHVCDTAGLAVGGASRAETGRAPAAEHARPRTAAQAPVSWPLSGRAFETHFDPRADHLRFYTRATLSRLLGEFGFRAVSVRAAAGPPGARRLLLARAVRSRW